MVILPHYLCQLPHPCNTVSASKVACVGASYFLALNNSDVSWIDITLSTTVKVSECKLGLFEHAQSIFKQPIRSLYIGNIVNYLIYLPDPFPRGLEVTWKGAVHSQHLYYQFTSMN